MAVKKLPKDVHTLITASIRINSFKTAVEELVYNALDAGSTSVAIRLDIEGNCIQVIDNGCGVKQDDFPLLGERHATSKCVDMMTLKAVPSNYGFRGQFLSALIQVSRSVAVTSRAKDSEDTFCKLFEDGRETDLSETTRRPSKGTTVEVKGFLYNMNIRKKSIDHLQELRDVKSFLEQLSLVHSNVSISLRDDSNNDIIFKLHKNRDIYQTLSTLFEVEKADVQELIVEKNLYKVVAYIGKMDRDVCSKHLIYLNGRFTNNGHIYKKINDQLVKTFNLKFQTGKKVKSKATFYEKENVPSDARIPFYLVFITCPYYDYDISNTPKHSMLEFKNWDPINKLIEKVIKFYAGDLNLKDIKKQNNIPNFKVDEGDETRDKVRKIVEKMLGNTIRKPGVSQMQHGVKGKLIRRKRKKHYSVSEKDIALSHIVPSKKTKRDNNFQNNINQEDNAENKSDLSVNVFTTRESPPLEPEKSNIRKDLKKGVNKKRKLKIKINSIKKPKIRVNSPDVTRKPVQDITKAVIKNKMYINENMIANEQTEFAAIRNKTLSKSKIMNEDKVIPPRTETKNRDPINDKVDDEIEKTAATHDPILEKFKKQTESIKKKCEVLSKNVEALLTNRKKSNHETLVNKTVKHNDSIDKNHDISVQQKIEEHVGQELPLQQSNQYPCTFDNRNWKVAQKNVQATTYDLVHTILTSQKNNKMHEDYQNNPPINIGYSRTMDHSKYFVESTRWLNKKANLEDYEDLEQVSSCVGQMRTKLTYESHHYGQVDRNRTKNTVVGTENFKQRTTNFISTKSREYFEAPYRKHSLGHNFKLGFRNQFCFPYSKRRSLMKLFKQNGACAWKHQWDSDYTIEFSKSRENIGLHYRDNNNDVLANEKDSLYSPHKDNSPKYEQYATYTIIEQSNTYDQNGKDFEFRESVASGTSHQITFYYGNHTTNSENYRGLYKTYNENQKTFKKDEQVHKDHIDRKDEDNETVKDRSRNNQCKETEKETETRERKIEDNNILIISETQDEDNAIDEEIDPLDVCVTVHSQNYVDEDPFTDSRCNDALFNDEIDLESFLFDRNIYEYILTSSNSSKAIEERNVKCGVALTNLAQVDKGQKENNEQSAITSDFKNFMNEETEPFNVNGLKCKENERLDFRFRNRPRFVPKGLSPIFENCQTKAICSYTFDKDHYEESIYNDFVNNVQANTEVFEPRIQNVKELTTRDIEKVNSKLNKDNASLIFDGESLKNILVLGQVDQKFIAAKIKGKGQQSSNVNESLVLFDQHAVHERIRLEQNMSDYFDGQQWKSIALDEITVKLSTDELVYLHNYKDKFTQFGLQWTITARCEVAITAIPEALLGKNPRQVEVIVKAIKNLIKEEISAIKSQKGCVILYPKSIMDLVFSEACRYAIKFGDSLSKRQCEELLVALSDCKTPFQCAHGRPVMAVLIDVQKRRRDYTVNWSKIKQFLTDKKKS